MFRSLSKKRREDTNNDGLSPGLLVTALDPTGGASEDYRALRTSLLYTLVDSPPKAIIITSPGPAEGKSTTCANLGLTLAQAEKSTLILDCDLRQSSMHRVFELRNFQGMVSVLVGECRLQEAWQEPLPGLKVLTAGPMPPNPAELLGSRRFAEFLGQVRQEFDYVLLDAPPTGLVSDPTILAAQGDGVLLVLDARNTRRKALQQSVHSLRAVGAKVLGTVMNNVEASKGGYYYGYSSK